DQHAETNNAELWLLQDLRASKNYSSSGTGPADECGRGGRPRRECRVVALSGCSGMSAPTSGYNRAHSTLSGPKADMRRAIDATDTQLVQMTRFEERVVHILLEQSGSKGVGQKSPTPLKALGCASSFPLRCSFTGLRQLLVQFATPNRCNQRIDDGRKLIERR